MSGGFDLKVIQGGDIEMIQEMTLAGFKLLSRIFSFPRPVIAACSGHAVALGTFYYVAAIIELVSKEILCLEQMR